jgi:Uma2 family endonuclease
MAVGLIKRPLTVEQFNRMIASGIIPENDRVELVDGDIVEMAPIGVRHASYVSRVVDVLHGVVPAEMMVWVQNPVELSPLTRVEPDVTLVRRRADYYVSRLPRPEDILLVVEVADTSLEADRAVKIPAYAKASVPEAWLVDAATNRIEVFRTPSAEGYRERRVVAPGDELSLVALPGIPFSSRTIIGPTP